MKKPLALVLFATMLLSLLAFSGCSGKSTEDFRAVQDKGTLVIGVVEAAPLTVQEDGEWTGFAVDVLKDFAKSIRVKAEFQSIEWADIDRVLAEKTVDCISSALTITPERKEKMTLSSPYLYNEQIVVTKANVARRYSTAEECLNLKFAVLDGSIHEDLAKEHGFLRFATNTTEEALEAVSEGRVDAAITNSTTANTFIGKGNRFPDLAKSFRLAKTQFGFGFRKNSDLAPQINNYLLTAYTGGTLTTLAKKYDLQKLLVEQVSER